MASATNNAFRRGRETVRGIVRMVDELVHPRDREPFMDAMRVEVREWFQRREEDKARAETAKGEAMDADTPPQANSSLREINMSLKKKRGRRRRNSAKKSV